LIRRRPLLRDDERLRIHPIGSMKGAVKTNIPPTTGDTN
jgi:hypothetical protein